MGDAVKDLLEALVKKGEARLAELNAMLSVSDERIKNAVGALESLGLVYVERRDDDVTVRLTADARRLLTERSD